VYGFQVRESLDIKTQNGSISNKKDKRRRKDRE